jgi:hypothetical protein
LKTRQGFQRVRRQKLHFFRRGQLSGRAGKKLKAQRKRLKAKAQGNENRAQGNENIESSFFNRLWQIPVPGAPLTLTFCGSR